MLPFFLANVQLLEHAFDAILRMDDRERDNTMELFISSARDMPSMIYENSITHVLSVMSSDELGYITVPSVIDRENWLKIEMDDVIHEDAYEAPRADQVQQILDWGRSLPSNARVLVHCYAGISRSTGAALALKVQEKGLDQLERCVDWLVDHRPIACPNPLVTKHADQILGANGELHRAAEAVANSKLIKHFGQEWREIFNRDHIRE